jgi:hypothetical protein
MKPFHTIAVPHRDILEGRLTMDVFAADLWEVSQGRGPEEYRDPDEFFRKTYPTQGLENLLQVVEKRLSGLGGDPVIQIQTPFGGGKTHALIAMYHRCRDWGAKPVVISGTALSPQDTLWAVMEEQLTGKLQDFTEKTAPGKEAIRNLLSRYQPVLILLDEVLEYGTKAAGVTVGESSLAAQTIAFLQELTEAAGTLERACVVVTLPASILEHYDEGAERIFQRLQKVAGRVEKIYTPVNEDEITHVISRRLFADINREEAKKVVTAFVEYADREGILPPGTQPTQYRDRFLNSYPFLPEVVDFLYHRWGSFPTFQRTRGVLRLLSLVVHSLKETSTPYISLADFDLSNQEIRQELLKHIGAEFNSVIGNDITDTEAGAKKVDRSLGGAYQGLSLGTRAATAIFMGSFSGGQERGVTPGEIKRLATTTENPSSVVLEAVDLLKSHLFYLQSAGGKYFFSNQPNLNRILVITMDNITHSEVQDEEIELLKHGIRGGRLKVFLWPRDSSAIPDTEELKLVILPREDRELMESILTLKGHTPRVYHNTIFFLYPRESERQSFTTSVKRKLSFQQIQVDESLNLTEEQRKEVRRELQKAEETVKDALRRMYRGLGIPQFKGLKTSDLGIPTYGEDRGLDEEAYEKLRSDGEILERIAPLVLREKYLGEKDYVYTEQLYQSALKTPGEKRPTSKSVLENAITEGVHAGLFALGERVEEELRCHYFKETPSVALSGSEVILKPELCQEERHTETETTTSEAPRRKAPEASHQQQVETQGESVAVRERVTMKFRVPKGKVSSLMGVMNLLQSKFENLYIEINATEGAITEQDYEDKIKETFRQLGIKAEER